MDAQLAVHEAGHLVVARALGYSDVGFDRQRTEVVACWDREAPEPEVLERDLRVALAGEIAEELYREKLLGLPSMKAAEEWLLEGQMQMGTGLMTDARQVSVVLERLAPVDRSVVVERAMRETRELLDADWDAVECEANALLTMGDAPS